LQRHQYNCIASPGLDLAQILRVPKQHRENRTFEPPKTYFHLIRAHTDAHDVAELGFMRHSVDQARRGWLEAHDVINTRDFDRLKAALKKGRDFVLHGAVRGFKGG
jgi:hypothetical protein